MHAAIWSQDGPTRSAWADAGGRPAGGLRWSLGFLGLRQRYSLVTIARRLADLLEEGVIDDQREDLLELRHWSVVDRFDRRAVNRQLAQVLGHPVGDLVAS